MQNLALLSLDLRASLDYRGLENPPFRGSPFAGSLALADAGAPGGLAVGDGLAEGEEEIFVFDAEALVSFDPDEGPSVRPPLPPPGFYGRRKAGDAAGGAYGLAKGIYLFLQFRPGDEAELARGLEWFAREAWWEGSPGRGPYVVRRLREDGRLATQVLRLK